MPKATGDGGAVRSAERMLRVLSWFGDERPSGTAAEISRDLELASSTVRRLLAVLEAHRYVARDGDGRYRPHYEIVRLHATAIREMDIVRLGGPVLDAVHRVVDETVLLTVFDPPDVLYIDARESAKTIRIHRPRTGRYKAYEGGASGRVFLATLDDQELAAALPVEGRWDTHVDAAPATLDELHPILAEVRLRGYAVNDGHTDPDLWSVAAPVYDHRGHTAAAICISARRRTVGEARATELASAILDGAHQLSMTLCHPEGEPTPAADDQAALGGA